MAIKQVVPGTSSIVTLSRGTAYKIPKSIETPGGLYPMRMAYWETDEYRIAAGWPVAEPNYDIRAHTLVSATGEVLSNREQALGITTGANVRWVADSDMFDITSLTWFPHQNEFPLYWQSSPDYAPTLIEDYEYTINDEIFTETALNFDTDSFEHMWADLNPMVGGSAGYSVVMCLSLNSVYGNNQRVPYAGLWSFGSPTPAAGGTIGEAPTGGWFSLTVQGTMIYLESDQTPRTKVLAISDLLATTAPIMIGMVFGRPYTTICVGRGPSHIRSANLNVGAQVKPLDGRVVLGRTTGDIQHTADMAMLDLGIYADRLTAGEMKAEFAALSSVYGGDK